MPILKGKGPESVVVATRRRRARDIISEALSGTARGHGLEAIGVGDTQDSHSPRDVLQSLQGCTRSRLVRTRSRLVAGFAAGETGPVTLLDLGLAAFTGCMAFAPAIDAAHVCAASGRSLALSWATKGCHARSFRSSLATATGSSLKAAGHSTPGRFHGPS